jgi:hypothetical protein
MFRLLLLALLAVPMRTTTSIERYSVRVNNPHPRQGSNLRGNPAGKIKQEEM